MRSPVLSPRQFEWTLVAFSATLAAHLLWLPIWLSATLVAVVLARWLQRRAYARAWPAWVKFPLLLLVLALVVAAFANSASRQAGPTAALIGLSIPGNEIDGRFLDLYPGEGTSCPVAGK